VTGGAGYVGSVVAEVLVGRGHDVVVLDNLSTGHRDAIPRGCTLIEGDIRDERALARALDGAGAVLHFAALSVVADSVQRPLDYFDRHVTGTTTLVRAMRARVSRWSFRRPRRCAPPAHDLEEAPCRPATRTDGQLTVGGCSPRHLRWGWTTSRFVTSMPPAQPRCAAGTTAESHLIDRAARRRWDVVTPSVFGTTMRATGPVFATTCVSDWRTRTCSRSTRWRADSAVRSITGSETGHGAR
jgi:hypothetical protein